MKKPTDAIAFASPRPQPDHHYALIHFGGTELHLLPERALWWPAENTLFVADLHVGKEATFRAAGLPIPDIFGRDLARLGKLIDRLSPQRLYILGDLLHDRSAHAPDVFRVFTHWRGTTTPIEICLVRGNHDRRAGDPPTAWQITCLNEPAFHGDLQLRHIPRLDDSHYTLAGHLHPKHRVSHGPDQLRLPCFLKRRNTLTLPAFAEFIDHATITRESNDSVFVVAGSEVIPIGVRPKALRRLNDAH